MSQIWSFLHRDSSNNITNNEDRERGVDYFNHHLQSNHSSNSDSTIEGEDEHIHGSPTPDHETFNSQLKRRLSNLTTHKKPHQQQEDGKAQQQHHHHHTHNNRFQTPKKGESENCVKCSKKDESSKVSCDCLIDEQDDQVNEIVSPIVIKATTQQPQNSIDSNLLSPNSLSTTSSLIFERNVQDQITNCCCTTATTNTSRRNSQNLLARTQSYSSQSSIPTHLNSEFFIPQVLDATTEVLTDPNYNENVEVITSGTNCNLSSNLLASDTQSAKPPGLGNRRMSRSLPISRRQSGCSPLSPVSTTSTNNNNNVDYSDKKKLNFYSFADLLSDESDVLVSPTSPRNNSISYPTGPIQQLKDPFHKDHIFMQPVAPAVAQNHSTSTFPSLSKTSSIKEILLENQSELGRSVS